MLKRFKAWLRQPAYGGIVLFVAAIGGMLLWGGFSTALDYTNRTEFCISCHEMRDTVYAEYRQSVHYKNASGVRAECADCHVPRALGPKLLRKIGAANDLYHAVLGSIDTPEKFEAKRLLLAERVWKIMAESNSRECRHCHTYEAMDFHKQDPRAREKMEEAMPKNSPCTECHQGVAHKKPLKPRDD